MENDLIASKANCKLANVPSGNANAAQRSSRNMLHIPPSGAMSRNNYFILLFVIYQLMNLGCNYKSDTNKKNEVINCNEVKLLDYNFCGKQKIIEYSEYIYEKLEKDLLIASQDTSIKDLIIRVKGKGTIPKSISRFKHLKCLTINFDTLYNIPNELSYLSNLEGLYLFGVIDSFPPSFKHFKRLKSVEIFHLNLVEIPDFIYSLDSIQYLHPYNILKLDFEKLKRLKRLRRLIFINQPILNTSNEKYFEIKNKFKKDLPCVDVIIHSNGSIL